MIFCTASFFFDFENFPGGDFLAEVQMHDIDTLRPSKCQDLHKLNFENSVDYKKVKYLLSRIPLRWAANDFTKTIYFCGKKL